MRLRAGSTYVKNAPKRYRAKDAPYAVGGKGGMIVSMKPRPYPKTAQQKKVAEAAKSCGIKSGISKSALMTAMRDCIPGKF
jgi:hypothetical protein